MATTSNTHALTERHEDLAYRVSRWEALLWDERHEASTALQNATGAVAAGLPAEDDVEAIDHYADAEGFGREVFARLYDDPAKLEEPAPPWARIAHEAVDGLPEWEALRRSVATDPDLAALAALSVLDGMAERMPELAEEAERQKAGEDEEGAVGNRDVLRAAARAACRQAAVEASETRALLNGLAPGLGHVPPTHEQADPSRLQLAERLRADARLQDVLRQAGRLQRISAARQRSRSVHAREEVVDVERGADLSRVLPSQLAGLRHPTLRLLALKGVVERSLVQYRLEGKEPLGRGPIVVLLDESYSMVDRRSVWDTARAIGIACVGIASKEHRPVTVAGFDDQIRGVVKLAGREGPKAVAAAALTIAGTSTGGGTSFDAALGWALDAGLEDERADLVLVTDGCCGVSDAILARLQAAKAKGLRVFAICLNGGSLSPSIAALADESVDLDQSRDGDQDAARCLP